MSFMEPHETPLKVETQAAFAARDWTDEVAAMPVPRGWKGQKARIAYGQPDHDREWVVNVEGYGPLSTDCADIPRDLGEWLAVELGIEPGTWCVQNRGSRIEVMIGEADGPRLRAALARTGLIVENRS
jgi:hypothetical protein